MQLNRIREIVDARDISRYRFWKQTGLDRATAYRLYNDPSYIPSEPVLEKICKAYGLRTEDLLKEESDPIAAPIVTQTFSPQRAVGEEHLTLSELETWFWAAACAIRGAADAPRFMDFILPLVFYKRLCDVFEDEFAACVQEFGNEALALKIIEEDYTDALQSSREPIVRFYIPQDFLWDSFCDHPNQGLGEFVTNALRTVAHLNPALRGVLDIQDFNETTAGIRTLSDERLADLIQVLSRHRLGLKNIDPEVLGQAYEYLVWKFAEAQGKKGGEFYTPKEIGWLIAELIDPEPFTTIYDPACGSGGLLIKIRQLYEQRHPGEESKAPKLYGQDINQTTFAIAKMNMILHDYTDSFLAIGDTFHKPIFGTEKSGLKRFDYVVANPPWNMNNYDQSYYISDPWGRFPYGIPPKSSADWGWVQLVLASMNADSRAAIILPPGAVFRGSGSKSSNVEKDIRRAFIENDLIEGVILLPDRLFSGASIPAIILLLNRNKKPERRQQILLINASSYSKKERQKNILDAEGITTIAKVYHNWETRDKLSQIISLEEARAVDYNILPSKFVDISEKVQYRPLNEILADLSYIRTEKQKVNLKLENFLSKLGIK